jgi:hypothetical protein
MPSKWKQIRVPHLGRSFCLVPLRILRRLKNPRRATMPKAGLPPVPGSYDWSQGEKLIFPVDGNDQYGDCYYACIAHGSNCFTGNGSTECSFDVNALDQRYLTISGGDNGLGDDQAMPEWLGGIIGPNGPRKILDYLVVDMTQPDLVNFCRWAFCGLVWTCSLLSDWENQTSPGSIWDAGSAPDPNAGHAMFQTGVHSNGNIDTRTWGISPPIQVTPAGVAAAQSEYITAFSLDMFNPQGYAPCGLHYVDLANYWVQVGGKALPPNPFPAPLPTPPSPGPDPVPPTPPVVGNVLTITSPLAPGTYTLLGGSSRLRRAVTTAFARPEVQARLRAGGPILDDLLILLDDLLLLLGLEPVPIPLTPPAPPPAPPASVAPPAGSAPGKPVPGQVAPAVPRAGQVPPRK